ncbi:Lcat [Symbiodinium sp. CCMP2456]|nr:Lcat [Symbiodinium sp. CCMP2456]
MGGVQFIATCCYDTSYNARAQKGTKTVIMVHGIAACALQNKIKPGTDAGCYLPCCREPGWNLAWASFEAIVTGPELLRNTLELEQVEGRLKDGRKVFVTKDQDGVEVRPYPGLDGIATINPGEEVMIPVLYELIDKLVDQYRLQPANYDWRKWGDLSFMESYKESLAKQVEEEFAQTQQPVSLIGHSMGCSVLLYVLTVMGSNWQQQYLDKVIFITPVVMGCPKGCSAFAHNPVGIISGLGTLPEGIENYWKQAVVASPATGCLLPLPVGDVQAFPDESHIVVTPKRGYAAHQIPEFIFDLKGALGPDAARFDFFPYARETAARLEPPAVPTHLIYGRNMHTINQLTFKTEDFQDIPEVTDYVSGDGTVTAASVEKLHKAWVGKGAQIFLHGAPESVADEHLTIVSSEWLLGVVPELLKD